MDSIKVTFEHEGKPIIGEISKVMGAGSSTVWHLYVNRYFWGSLYIRDQLVHNSNNIVLSDQAIAHLEFCLVSWYQ